MEAADPNAEATLPSSAEAGLRLDPPVGGDSSPPSITKTLDDLAERCGRENLITNFIKHFGLAERIRTAAPGPATVAARTSEQVTKPRSKLQASCPPFVPAARRSPLARTNRSHTYSHVAPPAIVPTWVTHPNPAPNNGFWQAQPVQNPTMRLTSEPFIVPFQQNVPQYATGIIPPAAPYHLQALQYNHPVNPTNPASRHTSRPGPHQRSRPPTGPAAKTRQSAKREQTLEQVDMFVMGITSWNQLGPRARTRYTRFLAQRGSGFPEALLPQWKVPAERYEEYQRRMPEFSADAKFLE